MKTVRHLNLSVPAVAVLALLLCCSGSEGSEVQPAMDSSRLATATQLAISGEVVRLRQHAKGNEGRLIDELEFFGTNVAPGELHAVELRRPRISIAALGDQASRIAIKEDLGSEVLATMNDAFYDAAAVGGNDIIAAIAERLDDPSPEGTSPGPIGGLASEIAFAAPRHMAVNLLSRLIDEQSAPRVDPKLFTEDEESVQRWRDWWSAHRGSSARPVPDPRQTTAGDR